ncbi:MAG: hypothetical protein KIT72_12585 [Polyangiaceae bacterium]|nr:hypothetical protein [Polyangiaceae bacterium]MCW5791251.1 hypothetical protein [Polyangiaceae bacterium]
MIRASTRALLGALTLTLSPSCGPTCDDAVPCHDALIIALPLSDPGDYHLSLHGDFTEVRCELRLEADGRLGTHECDSDVVHLGAQDDALWLLMFGTPSDVTLRLERGGAPLLERRLSPDYVDLREGSRGCVSCLQAEIDLTR